MKEKQTTRRGFLQAMGAVAMFGDDEDEESWWDKLLGDDDEVTGKSGTYTLKLGTREEFESTEAEAKTAFKVVPDGPVYRAVDDEDSLISGESKWKKIPSSGANPTFEDVESKSLETDNLRSDSVPTEYVTFVTEPTVVPFASSSDSVITRRFAIRGYREAE